MRVMTHMPTRKKKTTKRASGIVAAATSSSTGAGSNNSMRLEKMAICALLLIAWGWIMVTMAMVFYHGYYNQRHPETGFRQHAAQYSSFPGQKAASTAMEQLRNNLRFTATAGNHHDQEQEQGGRQGEGLGATAHVQHNEQQQPNTGKAASAASVQIQPHESPLLIFTCHREEYLNQTLADIFRYIPRDCSMGCPVIISQDGQHEPVAKVIKYYQEKFDKELNIPLVHWQHTSALRGGGGAGSGAAAYKALAVHYGWALQQVFENKAAAAATAVEPKRVLILEEDLHVAIDFFDYFIALAPILDRDASLLAISAYNDNGFDHAVQNVQRVMRSDFFPGLGWMMTRKLWTTELQVKWPPAYWDDWLREPAQRQGRHILRPEVSRTFHFGVSGGASNNQFGNQLSKVLLNPTPVQWSKQDLSYLNLQHFDRAYWQMLHSSRRVTSLAEARELIRQQQQQAAGGAAGANRRPTQELVLRLEYNNMQEFVKFASSLGLSSDEKAGVPRTAYKGVVETRFGTSMSASAGTNMNSSNSNNNHILLLTPPMQELQKEFEDVI